MLTSVATAVDLEDSNGTPTEFWRVGASTPVNTTGGFQSIGIGMPCVKNTALQLVGAAGNAFKYMIEYYTENVFP